MEGKHFDFEVIVVDDGSSDSTSEIVSTIASSDPRVRLLVNRKNMGKGNAVRRGIEASRGDVILFSDADLSTPIEEIEKLLPELGSHDFVIASRSLPASKVEVHQPPYREMMGKIFNILVRLLVMRGFIDTQCGFKLLTAKAASGILPLARVNSFSFDVELILIARRQGFGVIDVPVRWIDSRSSKVHPLFGSAQMLLDLFRIKLYDVLGYYKKAVERE